MPRKKRSREIEKEAEEYRERLSEARKKLASMVGRLLNSFTVLQTFYVLWIGIIIVGRGKCEASCTTSQICGNGPDPAQ